jgi:hypothetical protein
MKRMTKVLLALALTAMPTGVLYAALEDYQSPSCTIHPTLGAPWINCQMNHTSGCTSSDWSMDANVQSTGFAGCALTIEGGNVGFWAMSLGALNGSTSRHVGCDKQKLYYYYMNQGSPSRFIRCRSLAQGSPLPSSFSVRFGANSAMCIPPTP